MACLPVSIASKVSDYIAQSCSGRRTTVGEKRLANRNDSHSADDFVFLQPRLQFSDCSVAALPHSRQIPLSRLHTRSSLRRTHPAEASQTVNSLRRHRSAFPTAILTQHHIPIITSNQQQPSSQQQPIRAPLGSYQLTCDFLSSAGSHRVKRQRASRLENGTGSGKPWLCRLSL